MTIKEARYIRKNVYVGKYILRKEAVQLRISAGFLFMFVLFSVIYRWLEIQKCLRENKVIRFHLTGNTKLEIKNTIGLFFSFPYQNKMENKIT